MLAGPVGSRLVGAASQTTRSRPDSSSRLLLEGQTAWVKRVGQGFTLDLSVSSGLPLSRLGLHVTLYSKLITRDAFDGSVYGSELGQVVLDAPPTIPLDLLRSKLTSNGTDEVTVTFPVTTGSASLPGRPVRDPPLPLSCQSGACDGVYPLEVQLVEADLGTPLDSFTTHLIYTASAQGTVALGVGLVLPIGTAPALSPSGRSAISSAQLDSVRSLASTLTAYADVPVTLALYPQLLAALGLERAKPGRQVLAQLERMIKRRSAARSLELLGTPFSDVDPRSLATAGLGRELSVQLERATEVFTGMLGIRPRASPFVVPTPVGSKTLELLGHDGATRLVLPESNVSIQVTSTMTAPFNLLSPSSTAKAASKSKALEARGTAIEAFVSDRVLASRITTFPGDPELDAADLLAELTQIYFDAPNASQDRGVVVAPATWGGKRVIAPLLEGLASSNVLRAVTLDQLFASVQVGADGSPSTASLIAPRSLPPTTASARALERSQESLGAVASVLLPSSATTTSELTGLAESILIGESNDLSTSQRSSYLGSPGAELRKISASLSLGGSRSVTLTAANGRVPVTINSTFPVPLRLVLGLSSDEIEMRGPPLALTVVRSRPTYVEVTTRSSGRFTMRVEVRSPLGDQVLLQGPYVLTSTAVSLEAILISVAAALVLGLWWARSAARRRRAKMPARRHPRHLAGHPHSKDETASAAKGAGTGPIALG